MEGYRKGLAFSRLLLQQLCPLVTSLTMLRCELPVRRFECRSDGSYLQLTHVGLEPSEEELTESAYTGPVRCPAPLSGSGVQGVVLGYWPGTLTCFIVWLRGTGYCIRV